MASKLFTLDCCFSPSPSLDWLNDLEQEIENVLKSLGLQGTSHKSRGGGVLATYLDEEDRCLNFRVQTDGLITIDLTDPVVEDLGQPTKVRAEQEEQNEDAAFVSPWGEMSDFVHKLLSSLEKILEKHLGDRIKRLRRLPPLLRGGPWDPYLCLSDGRLVQYDVQCSLWNSHSGLQQVDILRSQQYGSMLLLDRDLNLAESDLAYTDAITGDGCFEYHDKDVLVLGGGDGAILNHLRKKEARFITMLEIDAEVMLACRTHLRGACEDSLDKLKGKGYEIVVGDCVPVMHKYVQEDRKFDYVINDLTAVPLSSSPHDDDWEFFLLILHLSLKVLKGTGTYFTQGNGASDKTAHTRFEHALRSVKPLVEFSRKTVCVPSYMELWVFYTVWKMREENDERCKAREKEPRETGERHKEQE
uniref:Spermine synthase n=1 Tax=Eptatretus burgeri TaxID=7764 RepID=A0A8C4N0Z1_EPTBU